ncbi:transglycosylase domain-containing protein [Paenibacillus herberti]|uniref:Penicillin-binding protein n=1 Tax=Paenibacillus herberti TaxID=1619309 RepID=A0A229P2F5_9BACL|nr:penicillin-binding protein 1A [Paenibacillus herberti]OXM16476.1 penicillin-binding protein [Paenibacillus herberti]
MTEQRKKGESRKGPGTTAKGRKRSKTSRKRKWFYGLFFAGALAVICAIVGYLLVILNGERILAANRDVLLRGDSSVIYDSSNNKVASLASVNSQDAQFNELPKMLRDAFIATEDQRFENHSGIDVIGIGRAIVKDIIARSAVEGASTITQQLARNLFLNQDKTFFRKATEASIAVALENQMSKDEILTMYLNRIYFGNGVYGVKLAAKYYFNSSLEDLKLWQMASLAAIPKAPSYYNPKDEPEDSLQRRSVVLKLMQDQGYITEAQRNEAKAIVYKPLENYSTGSNRNKFMTYVDFAVKEAVKVTGKTEDQIRLGGFKIYTSLNANAQQAVEDAFNDPKNFEESSDDQKAQGAMVIMDHADGSIKAMIGGRDYVRKGWNRATVPRQPGSSFKPITAYGPALETGDYDMNSILRDDKKCYGDYCPTDSNRVKYIGPVSMSQSIKESRNASTVWLLNEIGVSKGVAFSEKLGMPLDKKNDRNLSIALGGLTTGVSPLQMATAYSAFANDGKSVDTHTIDRIEGPDGSNIYEYKSPKSEQLMKEETADAMTAMLQEVLKPGGTGLNAAIDRPVAGKTGTTQHGIPGLSSSSNRDVWFVGYTPEWTAAVWMGYDKTDKQHLLKKGSSTAASLFSTVMEKAMKDVPRGSFDRAPQTNEPPPEQKNAPEQVKDLRGAYDENSMLVSLSWTPISGEGISYRLYRKASMEAEYTRVLDAATGEATDLSVAPGMSYEYYVTAYNSATDQEGVPSAKIAVEIPGVDLSPPPLPSSSPTPSPTPTLPPEESPLPTLPPDGGGWPSNEPPLTTPTPTPPPDQPAGGLPGEEGPGNGDEAAEGAGFDRP